MTRIPLIEPYLGGREAEYLAQCVATNYVSSVGPFVSLFEREFAAFVHRKYAVACASGTAALHAALLVAGVGKGDVVPVSTLTFIASVNAIGYTKAEPLLVDSEPRSWNMDTELLRDRIISNVEAGEPPPRAIEIVHVLGRPANLGPILDLRRRFGTIIVEDAAESLGGMSRGPNGVMSPIGSLGDLSCYSFNGNKVITAGAGGMIATDRGEFAAMARHLTMQARLPGLAYVHDRVGFNYRMSNLNAAVGLAQLEQLGSFLQRKAEIARAYDSLLSDVPGVERPSISEWGQSSEWMYSVLCPSPEHRERAIADLHDANIEARPIWLPIHTQRPYLGAARIGGECATDLAARGMSLPSSVTLTPEQQDRVAGVLRLSLSASLGSCG